MESADCGRHPVGCGLDYHLRRSSSYCQRQRGIGSSDGNRIFYPGGCDYYNEHPTDSPCDEGDIYERLRAGAGGRRSYRSNDNERSKARIVQQ